MVIQFCCGFFYAWSVLNRPIDIWMYGSPGADKSVITFSIAIASFGISAAVMGPWVERKGPKSSILLGSTFYLAGHYFSALAFHLRQMWLLYLAYGVVGSFGSAVCYITAVSVLLKWFPDRRGMASGLAVSGCGAGAMVAAQLLLPLTSEVGLTVAFVILPSAMLVPMSVAGFVLRTPPPNFMMVVEKQVVIDPGKHSSDDDDTRTRTNEIKCSKNENLSAVDALTSRNFKLIYVMFFANSIFGLVLISRLANITRDVFRKSEYEGTIIVSINGMFDLVGRLIFSTLSDWVGRKNCFIVLLSVQLVILSLFTLITTTQTYWAFLAAVWILTGCYGTGFGILAAFLSDTFGPKNVGTCQGVIFTSWSLAGICGGLIFSALFDAYKDEYDWDPYPYNVNVWWILAVVVVGLVACIFIKPSPKDKAFMGGLKAIFMKMCHRSETVNTRESYEMNSEEK